MMCKIFREQGVITRVEDNNGNESLLFNQILSQVQNGYKPTDAVKIVKERNLDPNDPKEIAAVLFASIEDNINRFINLQILGKPDVILPIGTSGSGKSTFIKSLPQANLVIIEPDAMRVEFTGNINDKSKDEEIYIEAANRAIKAIQQGKQVVFDTTNLTKNKRLPFVEAIKNAIPTANIQYKLMELNPELAKQRIKAQLERGENRANVSDSTIDRHAETYKQMLEDIKNEPITPFNEILLQQVNDSAKEDYIASEKTIRDLAARMSDRIGIPIEFESDRTKKYKGKLENNVAYINLAHATLDTPIHEILGHPIVRALKTNNKQNILYSEPKFEGGKWYVEKLYTNDYDVELFENQTDAEEFYNKNNKPSKLYQNLLKELETGKGKEVFDRIKRDYIQKEDVLEEIDYYSNVELFKELRKIAIDNGLVTREDFGHKGESIEVWNNAVVELNGKKYHYDDTRYAWSEITESFYTLEEQEEEAIVELLGLYTADKLDKVKDRKLISLLKKLLKEMKAFMKKLLNQKEVEIDKLPDNMTIGDIADLLAYSNSKLILPGYEVVYTTPDNQKFKTYSEASKHIGKLSKDTKDVDTSSVTLLKEKPIYKIGDYFGQYEEGFVREEGSNKIETQEEADYLNSEKYRSQEPSLIKNFIEANKQFEQSKEIIEEWKRINNIVYNPEEAYSRGEIFIHSVGAFFNDFDVDLMLQNYLAYLEDYERVEDAELVINGITRRPDERVSFEDKNKKKGIRIVVVPKPEHIKWVGNTDMHSGSTGYYHKNFTDIGKERSGIGATKAPSLYHLSNIQASIAESIDTKHSKHSGYNEIGLQLVGNNFRFEYDPDVSYTTKKLIDTVNNILDQKYGKIVKPDITLKNPKSVFSVTQYDNKIETFNTFEEAQKFANLKNSDEGYSDYYNGSYKVLKEKTGGIQPTQTNATLKESIESIKNKVDTREGDFITIETLSQVSGQIVDNDGYMIVDHSNSYLSKELSEKVFETYREAEKALIEFEKTKPKKEYTSQALINTKIAKRKEVAKKYPRSLIRSEVKPIGYDYDLGFDRDELPFQKVSGDSIISKKINTENYLNNIELNKAKQWLEERGLPFDVKNQIYNLAENIGGKVAHGYFKDNLIYLWKNAANGTQYHEAFHAVFTLYLKDSRRMEILKEASTKYNEKDLTKLEEALANEFQDYMLTRQENTSLGSKILQFFKDLWNTINLYLGHGSEIDALFSEIAFRKGPFRFKRKLRDSIGTSYSLMDGFTTDEIEEVIMDITTRYVDISDSKKNEEGITSSKSIMEEVKNEYLRHFFKIDGQPSTVKEAEMMYALLHEKLDDYDATDEEKERIVKIFDNIEREDDENFPGRDMTIYDADLSIPSENEEDREFKRFLINQYKLLIVYENFNAIYDNNKNLVNKGWSSLAVNALSTFGVKIEVDETERIYDKSHLEENRKDKLSGQVKNFLARIRSGKKGIISEDKYVPFDEIYPEVAFSVVDSQSYDQMKKKLGEKANQFPNLYKVIEALEKKEIEDPSFIPLFYSQLAMTYNDFVLTIEDMVVSEENGKINLETKIRRFSANNRKIDTMIFNKWRNYAMNLLYDKTPSGELVLQEGIMSGIKTDLLIAEEVYPQTPLTKKHINALERILYSIGAEDFSKMVEDKTMLEHILESGVEVNNILLTGGMLYNYLLKGSGDGLRLRSLVEALEKSNSEELINIYDAESTTIKRLISVYNKFETDIHQGFVNQEGKLMYPINMHTTLTRMFNAWKGYTKTNDAFWDTWVSNFKKDVWYMPNISGFESPLVYKLLTDSNSRRIFSWEYHDSYKERGNDTVSTYETDSPKTSLLNRLNAFANNSNRKVTSIAFPTLADRGNLLFVNVPRIVSRKQMDLIKKEDIVRNPEYVKALFGYLLQDALRARKELKFLKEGGSPVSRYHKQISKKEWDQLHSTIKQALPYSEGMFIPPLITQLPFLLDKENNNWKHDEALELFGTILMEPEDRFFQNIDTILESKEAIIGKIIDEMLFQKDKLKHKLEYLELNEIKEENVRQKSVIDTKGYEDIDTFLLDYVFANTIYKNELIKLTGGDIAFYKDYEDWSKRNGGIMTPGLESFIGTEGDFETYSMGIVKDIFSKQDAKDSLEKLGNSQPEVKKLIEKVYINSNRGKGSNKTDAMGFITLEKYRRKAMGLGVWGENEKEAYTNYLKGKEFKTNKGVVPILNPLKTYHDGQYLVDGRMQRILVKHSVIPLLKEFTKNIPDLDALRIRMEDKKNPIDQVNMDSAVKSGAMNIFDTGENRNEKGEIDFSKLIPYPIKLNTRFERVPQIIPKRTKINRYGSQLMKLIVANMKEHFESDNYELNGQKIKGKEIFDKYQKAIRTILEHNQTELFKELGYDDYIINPSVANKKVLLSNLRQKMIRSLEDRDAIDNYIKALNIVEENGDVDFNIPLSMPVFQKRFEQILFSIFRKQLMTLPIHGKALVQIAEFGTHKKDGSLRFVHNENGKIAHAQVAIPYDLAYEMNLPKDENGEFDLTKIQEQTLDTIIGYRIPTQGKNSMLPLKIVRVLPKEMGKVVLVPGEITSQQGGDFDIDKLFTFMPNYKVIVKDKRTQEVLNENTVISIRLRKKGIYIEPYNINKMLRDKSFIEDIWREKRYKEKSELSLLEFEEIIEDVLFSWETYKKSNNVEITVEKLSYDEKGKPNSREQNENKLIDIIEAILLSPNHLKEMLSPIDSPTMTSLKEIGSKLYPEKGKKIKSTDIDAEEILQFRNQDGGAGTGIAATNTTGLAIAQYLTNYNLSDNYSVRFDGKQRNDLTILRDENGELITYLFSKHMTIAVDGVKDPIMSFINDNPFTSPVTVTIIRSGVTSKEMSNILNDILGSTPDETGLVGGSDEVAAVFRMQPIIVYLADEYKRQNLTPDKLGNLILETTIKFFNTSDSKLPEKSTDLNLKVLANNLKIKGDDILDQIKKSKEQLAVLNNFYIYHKAGSQIANDNKILNADRIEDLNSVTSIQAFYDKKNKSIGSKNVITTFGLAYNSMDENLFAKSFIDLIDTIVEVSNIFFPYTNGIGKGIGIEEKLDTFKRLIGKESLNEDQYTIFNEGTFNVISAKEGSPFREAYSQKTKYDLFNSEDSIMNLFDKINEVISKEENKDETIVKKILSNPFYTRLAPHPDNFKTKKVTVIEDGKKVKKEIKKYDFEELELNYGFLVSKFHSNQLTDGFMDMLNMSRLYPNSPTAKRVTELAKKLIIHNIRSKGFSPAFGSFLDILPLELWTSSEYNLFDSKESNITFANFIKQNQNVNLVYEDIENIIENNWYKKNLVREIRISELKKIKEVDFKHNNQTIPSLKIPSAIVKSEDNVLAYISIPNLLTREKHLYKLLRKGELFSYYMKDIYTTNNKGESVIKRSVSRSVPYKDYQYGEEIDISTNDFNC